MKGAFIRYTVRRTLHLHERPECASIYNWRYANE